jgi:hypothetical protein
VPLPYHQCCTGTCRSCRYSGTHSGCHCKWGVPFAA